MGVRLLVAAVRERRGDVGSMRCEWREGEGRVACDLPRCAAVHRASERVRRQHHSPHERVKERRAKRRGEERRGEERKKLCGGSRRLHAPGQPCDSPTRRGVGHQSIDGPLSRVHASLQIVRVSTARSLSSHCMRSTLLPATPCTAIRAMGARSAHRALATSGGSSGRAGQRNRQTDSARSSTAHRRGRHRSTLAPCRPSKDGRQRASR